MIPILYSEITEGTVPNDYGIGALTDCFSCKVTEKRNSIYELELEYAANGAYADQIIPGVYIKAKPNFTDNLQLFQIYKVGRNINGRFSANAQHVSYLLSGKVITEGSANNIVSACALLDAQAGEFTVNTTKNTNGDFTITEPSSIRSWFGGKQGSLLDVYGGGEWYYDNFTATLKQNRGYDRSVQIRYGKNLTELSQEIDMSNLASAIMPYYKNEEGVVITAQAVPTGLTGFDKTIAIDFSDKIDISNEVTSVEAQLEQLALDYVNSSNFITPLSNITLDFVQVKELADRVDLCDTVHIFFEPLGIEASMKCISTTWDVLEERYIETEFGDPRSSITDTIDTAQNTATTAITTAGSKSRVFTDTPVPPYSIGDLWVNGSDLYYCIIPKNETITGTAGPGNYLLTNTPIEEPLISCIFTIPQDEYGYDSITFEVSKLESGMYVVQATYTVDFGQRITTGGTLNVIEGVITLNDQEQTSIEVEPINIITVAGKGRIRVSFGTLEVEYLIEGFQMSDWKLATNYVSESRLEDAIQTTTEVITGATGGNVILYDSDGDGKPDEILIMDTEDIATALKIWRWNAGGLGYSTTGYNGPFTPAIDSQGRIVASMITTGNLDALKVTIEHLTASMFEGSKISLGGINNQSGVLELKDEAGTVIGELTKDGLKFYGAGPVGQRPYVVLNNTDGFKGYDALGNPLFWVNRDEFNMKKCVAVNEISACGILKMLPMTIEDNGTVVNKGLAFIPIV